MSQPGVSLDFSPDCVSDGKNAKAVVCKKCGSKVLKPEQAVLIDKEIDLPPTTRSKSSGGAGSESVDVEKLSRFWLVRDLFTFENVGFSNTVGTVKYLCCADCEIGPIGWHDVGDKTRYYVSVSRVNYV
eukprot:m.309752 g.309752  ORF g.309752 m.309752 type:complete len:129 (+) comp47612_c0_seq1:153-539(+)